MNQRSEIIITWLLTLGVAIVVLSHERRIQTLGKAVFSPPDGLVAGSQSAQAHHKSFSSPSSEVASDKSATFSFDELLDAIEWVESKGDRYARGDWKEMSPTTNSPTSGVRIAQAIGAFQLWKIYIDDFNRIQELNGASHRATYDDRWSREESRKITSVVISHYANHDWYAKFHTRMQWLETAARTHKNPTERNADSTKAYWLRVKARMEKVRIVEWVN